MSKKLNIEIINKALSGIEEFESPVNVLKDSSLFENAIEEIIPEPLYKGEREAINQIASAVRPFFIECIDLAPEEQEKHLDKALDALDRLDTEPQIKNGVFDLFCRNFKVTVKSKRRSSRPKRFWKYALTALAVILCLCAGVYVYSVYSQSQSERENMRSPQYYESVLSGNDADMQFSLAMRYLQGIDTDKDEHKAFLLFEKAYSLGNPLARIQLGSCYFMGSGVAKDYKKAVELLETPLSEDLNKSLSQEAVKDIEDTVQYILSFIYTNGGFGVKKDYKKALKYCSDDQQLFTIIIQGGPSLNESFKKQAAELLERNIFQGAPYAKVMLGQLYTDGGFGLEKDYKKSFACFKEAADKEEPFGYISLAESYENGWGVEKNKDEAEKLYQKAVNKYLKSPDDADAKLIAAECYQRGHGVKQDYAEAFKLFTQLAGEGNEAVEGAELPSVSIAQTHLAFLYENGFGVKQDYKKAFELYLKAAEQDNAEAQYRAAYFYENGLGAEKDAAKVSALYEEAFNGLQVSAYAGDENKYYAKYYLGECYEYGRGCTKNMEEAVKLYKEAAAYESDFELKGRAQKKLEELHIHLGEIQAAAENSPPSD